MLRRITCRPPRRVTGSSVSGGPVSPTPDNLIYGVSTVSSRTGFVSALVEFGGGVCPEQEDDAVVSLQFVESGGTVSSGTLVMGRPVWIQSADLSGTYTPSTGALSVTGTCGALAVAVAATYGSSTVTGTITVTNGAHEEIRAFSCTSGTAASLPSGTVYYVDSANGNDGNSGLTPALPKQTLAAVPELVNGDTVLLACGSRWREAVDDAADMSGTDAVAIAVEGYGVGPRPIVDAYDVETGWSLVVGRTYVYEATVAPEYDHASLGYINPIEDGVPLTPVADEATCEATTGSFVQVTQSGATNYTLQIHPSDDGDPTSNGKVYEFLSRRGIYTSGGSVRRVHVRGANNHAGGVTVFKNVTVSNGLIDDVLSGQCAIHGLSVSGNSVQSVDRSIVFWTHGQGAAGNKADIVTTVNPVAGQSIRYYDCGVIETTTTSHSTTMIWEPSNASSPASVLIEQCGFGEGGGLTMFSPDGVNWSSFEARDCLLEQRAGTAGTENIAEVYSSSATGSAVLTRCRFYLDNGGNGSRFMSPPNATFKISLVDCLVHTDPLYSWVLLSIGANGTLAATRTACIAGGSTPRFIEDGNVMAVSQSECFVIGCARNINLDYAGSSITAADYNVVSPGTTDQAENSGAALRDFSVYQGDQGTLDQHSGTTAPSWETGTDAGARPTYIETAASRASRGFDCGPIPCRPGSSVTWVTPPTYDAWKTFIDGL